MNLEPHPLHLSYVYKQASTTSTSPLPNWRASATHHSSPTTTLEGQGQGQTRPASAPFRLSSLGPQPPKKKQQPTTHNPQLTIQPNRIALPSPNSSYPKASETGTLSQPDKWQFAPSLPLLASVVVSLSDKPASEGLPAVRRQLHAAIGALLSQPPLLTLHASFFSPSRIFAFANASLRLRCITHNTELVFGWQVMG
jgi:hypothetical protein